MSALCGPVRGEPKFISSMLPGGASSTTAITTAPDQGEILVKPGVSLQMRIHQLQTDGMMNHPVDGVSRGHGIGGDVLPLRDDEVSSVAQ